jgi:hypothetical protein
MSLPERCVADVKALIRVLKHMRPFHMTYDTEHALTTYLASIGSVAITVAIVCVACTQLTLPGRSS